MKIEKHLKLYTLDTEVWLPEAAEIFGLALDGNLLQLVVWEGVATETHYKRNFVWIIMDDILMDAEEAIYIGSILDPELDERVYVFELR